MQVKVRPYIWESSNRPMFVRSVWLDSEGHRHVLLDEEVRKRKDVRSMRRFQTERASSLEDQLQCVGLSDIGISGKELLPSAACAETSTDNKDRTPSKKFDRGMGKLRACRKMCEKSDISFVSLKHHLTRQKSNRKGRPNAETAETSEEHANKSGQDASAFKEDESQKNQLTERVLQWLDKTGKFTSISPVVRKEKIVALPEINVKDNEGEDEWEATEKFEFAKKVMSAENILRPRHKTAVPLRRSESVHTLSLTFDEDDLAPNPYGISRCKSAALRFGDFFPTTYKCSKKFLSLCSRKTSASSSAQSLNNRVSPPSTSTSANNLTNLNELPETTTKSGIATNSIVISLNNLDLNKLEENCGMAGNRNSQNNTAAGMEINNNTGSSRRKKILRRKDTLIENQYKHIIHKHILETQCNKQIVKQQLHIFIPKLPKKDKEKEKLEENQSTSQSQLKPPEQDAECDSCLSTVFSEAN